MKCLYGGKRFRFVLMRFWVCLLFVIGSNTLLFAGSLQICVNNNHYRTFSSQELKELSYSVPTNEMFTYVKNSGQNSQVKGKATGITLDELFPVMVEAWEIEVSLANKTNYSIKSSSLAEELPFYILLLDDKDSLTSSLSLNIIGEISQDDSMEIWVSWEGVSLLKEEISRFSTLHGVTVKALEVPKISSKLIQTQQAGGNVPDVVMVQSAYIYELMEMDTIQPLDYINHGHYNLQGLNSFNLFNRQWAIPFYYDSQVLICNSLVMDQAGISPSDIKTLKDLEGAGEKIINLNRQTNVPSKTILPIVPLSWNLYSAYWLLPFQYGFGKESLIEKDGGIQVDDPATKEAINYLLSLVDRGILSANERDAMLANFVRGKTGMIFSASYMIPELEKLDFPFQIIPLPIKEDTGRQIAPILDYKGFSITKKSKNPILARRLIQYLSGIGVQQRFSLKMSKLPAWDIAINSNIETNSNQHIVKTGSKGGYEIPPDFAYGIYKNTMWNMIRLILDKKMSVDDGLAEAQRIIDIHLSDQNERLQKKITYNNTVGGRKNETEKRIPSIEDTQPNDGDNDSSSFINWLRKFW